MSDSSGSVFEKSFSNDLAELESVTDEALDFAAQFELSPATEYSLRLSIEEIATNIIKYAYSDALPHKILLKIDVQAQQIQLLLEDDGQEFDPLAAVEPDLSLPLEERPIGGLGIHLIRKFATRMEYLRRENRNRLSIWLKK